MRQQGKVVPSMVITPNTCTHSRAQNQPLLPIAQAQVSEPQTFAQKFRQQFPCHHVPWWMDWACRRVRHGALQQLLQLKPANFGNFRDQAPSKRVGRRQPRHAQLKWRNCKAWKKLQRSSTVSQPCLLPTIHYNDVYNCVYIYRLYSNNIARTFAVCFT